MGCFPLLSHPSIPALAKNLSRVEGSSHPSSTSVSVCPFFLSLSLSASISHYLTSSILSIEENPPTSPPAAQPHCHQSAPILLQGRLVSSPSFLSLFTVYSIQPFTLSLHLYLSSCDTPSFLLPTFVFLSDPQYLISVLLLFFPQTSSKQMCMLWPTSSWLKCIMWVHSL